MWVSLVVPSVLWAILTYFIVVLMAKMIGYQPHIVKLVIISGLIVLFRSLANLLRAFFRGLENMFCDALVQVIDAAIGLALVSSIIFHSATASSAMVLILAAALTSLIIAKILFVRKLIASSDSYRFDGMFLHRVVRAAVPLGFTFTLIGLNLRLDILILSRFVSENAIGLYSAAMAFVMLSRPVSGQSAASLLPTLSRSFVSERKQFLEAFEAGLRYTIIVSTIMGVCLVVLAPVAVSLFFGQMYLNAVTLLRALGPTVTFLSVNTYLWHVMIATNHHSGILLSAVAAIVATVVVSSALVPKFGTQGMAYTLVIREIVQMVCLLLQVRRTTSLRHIREAFTKPLPAMAFLAVALWPVHNEQDWKILLYLPVCLFFALLILVLTRGIRGTELALIKESFMVRFMAKQQQ